MRKTNNDREQMKNAARLVLCLWAGVICVTMLCSEVLGNKIKNVTVQPHYVGTGSPLNCGQEVCQCKYWAYVTWTVYPGSDQDSFTVEIWEPGTPSDDEDEDHRPPSGTMIGANSVGPSPWNTKVEITNSDALKPGEHTIRAWVAGDDISSPGKWGHSAACTVYIAEVNDIDPEPNESCVNSNVTFTADPNPPGKTLRCMEWQKGYKPDASSSWTWDEPEAGGASKVLNTSTPGIYCYQARNCKDYGCTACDWVQSQAVYVVEVINVKADTKEAGETLYLANDKLDEPANRTEINQSVEAILWPSPTTLPDGFSWSPACVSLPKICPDDTEAATFTHKDHGSSTITATCGSSSESMNIAIEGVNISTSGITEENEMTETYNVFLNENFNQELNPTSPAGHTTCYDKDHSDDSWSGDRYDELGTISLAAQTCGDDEAKVKFEGSNIKLYKSQTEKLSLSTYYTLSTLPASLRVEGTNAGTTTLKATIKTQDDYTAKDELKIKVIPVDLTAVDPAPSSDEHEICHKHKLFIGVNDNDSDNDGQVDLSDSSIPGGDPDLIHIKLEQPTGAVDSDISGDITITWPSNINAWQDSDKSGGAASGSYSSVGGLPDDIYLEGVSASSGILTSEVKVEMTLDSGVKCRDEIRYSVVDVDVVKPKGSLDAAKNPQTSWVLSPCYHFDFQALESGATGAYVLDIEGDIDPAAPLGYKWTLDSAAGTLANDTTSTPTHSAPASPGEGMLELKAMIDTTDTGIKEKRKVKIYEDHLARDYANFETGGYCINNWEVTTFNVDPQPVMNDWNCHGSTWHHWDGSGTGWATSLPPVGSPKKTVVVTHLLGGGGSHPPLGTLNRGDIVAYYMASGPVPLMHSQTCTGNGTDTYGANNDPLSYPGRAGVDESWKWATSTAGDWANDLWLPGTGIMPVTIKVYDKP